MLETLEMDKNKIPKALFVDLPYVAVQWTLSLLPYQGGVKILAICVYNNPFIISISHEKNK